MEDTPKRPDVPVRGEKQWQAWAGDHVEAQDYQTKKANTRLPYHSTLSEKTLVETEEQNQKVRGEKQWLGWAQATTEALDRQTD